MARVWVNNVPIFFTLSVTGPATAIWSGPSGVAVNLSIASDGLPGPAGGGAFRIFNPFGTMMISSLYFDVSESAFAFGARGSDYALSGLSSQSAAPVPEPASLLLMGSGLLGLASVARRRKRAAEVARSQAIGAPPSAVR